MYLYLIHRIHVILQEYTHFSYRCAPCTRWSGPVLTYLIAMPFASTASWALKIGTVFAKTIDNIRLKWHKRIFSRFLTRAPTTCQGSHVQI